MRKNLFLCAFITIFVVTANRIVIYAENETVLWDEQDGTFEEYDDTDAEKGVFMNEPVEEEMGISPEEEKMINSWEFVPVKEDDLYLQDMETGEWTCSFYFEEQPAVTEEEISACLPEYLDVVYDDNFTDEIPVLEWKIETKEEGFIRYIAYFSEQYKFKEAEQVGLTVYLPKMDQKADTDGVSDTISDESKIAASDEKKIPEKEVLQEEPESMADGEISEELETTVVDEVSAGTEGEVPEESESVADGEVSEEPETTMVDEVSAGTEGEMPEEPETAVGDEISDKTEYIVMLREGEDRFVYTGKPIRPELDIYFGDENAVLEPGVDYTVCFENNIDVGSAKIIIEYTDDSREAQEISFCIEPQELDEHTCYIADANYVYTGEELLPAISIMGNDGLGNLYDLEEGKDYEVSYYNNQMQSADLVNVGDIQVVVQGKGNFAGTIRGMYRIVACSLSEFQIEVAG